VVRGAAGRADGPKITTAADAIGPDAIASPSSSKRSTVAGRRNSWPR